MYLIAAEAGHLNIIEYLWKQNIAFHMDAIDIAAGKGHIDILEWTIKKFSAVLKTDLQQNTCYHL